MKYIFVFCLLIIFSCKKNDAALICLDGTIEWAGDPSVDGLGWVLRKDSANYFVLKNLPDSVQQPTRNVYACIKKTGERVPCECTNIYYYYIESIR